LFSLDAVARTRIIAVLLVALLPACSRTLRIPVPNGTPLQLVTWHYNPTTKLTEPKKVLLQPDTPEYRQLQDWITRNQEGWHQSLAPSTDGGVFIHSDDLPLHLQFEDDMVSVFTEKGDFHKDVREDEYAFLKPIVGI
jgi:hypothetical protein